MRLLLPGGLVLALLTATPLGAGTPVARIVWEGNFQKGLDRAVSEGKPVIVDFWATWCRPCDEMDRRVWLRRDVVDASKAFVMVRVDFDGEAGLCSEYRIEGIPTVVFVDPWGHELTRLYGFTPAEETVRAMRGVPKDFSAARPFQEKLRADPGDIDALRSLAVVYMNLGLYRRSNEFCEAVLKKAEAAGDKALKQDMVVAVGFNLLRLARFKEAQGRFERALEDYPGGARSDSAYLGLVMACLGRGKLAQADKVCSQLRDKFPSSAATRQAEVAIADARNRR